MGKFSTFMAMGLLGFSGPALASDFKTLVREQLQQADIAVPDTVPYNYLVSIEIDSRESDEDKGFKGQYRFNPSAPPGERTTLIDMAWEDLPKDMRKDMQEADEKGTEAQFAEQFWCAVDREGLELMASDEVTVIREDETTAVVSLGPKAIDHFLSDDGEGERSMPKKIKKRLLSELTFSKPELHLTHSKIWLSKPTTVKIIAKMQAMTFDVNCAAAPNGVPYFTGSDTSVKGKALGKSFQAQVNLTISDLRPN